MTKLERRYAAAAVKQGAEVLALKKHKGHIKITVACNGVQKTITCAGSPTNADISVMNFERDVRKYCQ